MENAIQLQSLFPFWEKLTREEKAQIQERCVACGACANVCPKGAVTIWKGCYAVVNTTICVGCGKCGKLCPAGCIVAKEGSCSIS